ncbi:DUF885 domain-containing protein [Ornithinimicrobium avium]|uniref:DUF885 domain-containing protein n=1 Tax=Ornithinimicrobium avium TaxID=2283195 RepID=A0A345NMW9_9MICO|nr:DUF885 domain-containing protein [Ornithinimicrobium avium]AXH96377.1 DUF885 domain-containing protein [Ornithinimicrobium avium]
MSESSAQDRFVAIYTEEWAWRERELGRQPRWISGELEPFLPDVSPPAQERRAAHWSCVRDQVLQIDPSELSQRARSDRKVYLYQLDTFLAQHKNRMFEAPINSDTAFWQDILDAARRHYPTPASVEGYLELLDGVPRHFQAHIANMRAGLARGFAPPRITMAGRDATARTVAEARSAADTDLHLPVGRYRGTDADRVAQHIGPQLERVLEEQVLPAFRELAAFLADDYFPHLPLEISATKNWGEEFYRDQVREFATLDLTPEQVHQAGLDAVAEITARMGEVAHEAGFDGDAPAMLAHMRTDPSFYVDTPQALLKEAAWHAKKFDGVVHQYFGRVPRQRFAIIEPPADLAPFYTFGRGGVDHYVLNTYSLPDRPLFSLPALTLHEAAPGHAFQIPYALEMTDLPPFRRFFYNSAYGEGWALYGEHLGVEMGMYTTPFETMGMLSYQMWRAVRLVVDPGIHALGWTRQQAIDYLAANTAIGMHEVVTEIDRYISWPGQAVAYYLGKTTILQARQRAEAALGDDFDLRAFHDLVLSLGAVPLEVLDDEVDAFVRDGGRSPFASKEAAA